MRSVKQVIVVRKDLSMGKGKIAAQSAHASMQVLLSMMHEAKGKVFSNLKDNYFSPDEKHYSIGLEVKRKTPLDRWLNSGYAKVCLYVNSEEELMSLFYEAQSENLPCSIITDAGITKFHGIPTRTCIAIGPHYSEEIDLITGHLKLL